MYTYETVTQDFLGRFFIEKKGILICTDIICIHMRHRHEIYSYNGAYQLTAMTVKQLFTDNDIVLIFAG